uniref:Uncharacterized protein n=1 Tax=Rhizophora mucronata TaxID=61149 RepID=A0A2P2N8J3_RHIMU
MCTGCLPALRKANFALLGLDSEVTTPHRALLK